jgi:hypothetical protein
LILLEAISTFTAVTIVWPVALIRGLYPDMTLIAKELKIIIHGHLISATMLAPVLVEVKLRKWIVPFTQGAVARPRVNRNIADLALPTQVRF